jgi:hypothetical protein
MMDDLRADFEAAYAKHEEPEKDLDQESTEEQLELFEGDSHETNEPEAPIDAKSEKPIEENKPLKPPEKIEKPEKPEKTDKVETKPEQGKYDKAPASWTPKAREMWKNVPAEARAQIAKREAEITQTLHQTAQARQGMQHLNRVLEPYKQGLIASGVSDPFQAIQTLFQTEAQLRGGTPVQKAETVARLIKNYGVDIGALDSILVGEQPKANPRSDIEAIIEQRLAPVNQFLQQQQYAQQQSAYQQQAQANQSVAEFSKNAEFIEDVRNDMADFLDLAAKNGYQMSLQQAYDKACALHPEIATVLENRAKQQRLMGTQNQMNAKRHAASSLSGTRGGEGAPSEMDLRSTISEAWDSIQG